MVFAAAFVAGAAAAVGINRALDVHLAQSKPQVECEPIFVALRSLPQGAPVTVWDVALRDWPKAMMPMTALRATDEFEGMIVRHPVREGQPLLSVQLVKAAPAVTPAAEPPPQVAQTIVPPAAAVEADLWTSTVQPPAVQPTVAQPAVTPATTPPTAAVAESVQPVVGEPTMAEPAADVLPPAQTEPAEAVSVVTGPATPAPSLGPQAEPAASTASESQAVIRYLVVPERIATQADNSFVTPKTTMAQPTAVASATPTATTPVPTAPTNPPKSPSAGGKKSVPQVAQHPGNRRPKPAPQAAPPKAKSTAKPSQPAAPKAQQPQRPQGMFGTMFPNLRAGIDAIEAELGAGRREKTESADQAGTGRPPAAGQRQQTVQPLPPAEKSARWPWSTGPRSF